MKKQNHTVGKKSDLKNNEMKVVEAGDSKVLLCRIDDKFYATSPICPHYGAPLEDGILSDKRVICPWHHSAFDVESGDLIEPPSRDALEKYEVEIDGEDVVVHLPEKTSDRRVPAMTNHDPDQDKSTYLIIGGGAAGNAAAQALREDGFRGRVVIVTSEEKLPYDRPNLSKDYLQGEAPDEWIPLRGKEFYERFDIEIQTGRAIKGVDSSNKTVVFDNDDKMEYDKLLLAMGGRPRRLDIPGGDLEKVFTLRSFADSDTIIKAAKSAGKAVIVGGGFIGMETAFSLKERDLDVTVVANESTPLEHIFGREIGELFKTRHEKAGITFKLGQTVREFQGDGAVTSVVLENGESIETDLAIVGVGVDPASDRIQGIKFGNDGSVIVDDFLNTEEDVYAAGDIACFPDWRTKDRSRIEHWRTAEQQGRLAAHNMMGKEIKYRSVPFFWTTQAGLHFRYVGHAPEWDEIVTLGDVEDASFISFFVKNDQILAAASVGRDKQMIAVEELMRLDRMPSPQEIKEDKPDLVAVVQGKEELASSK